MEALSRNTLQQKYVHRELRVSFRLIVDTMRVSPREYLRQKLQAHSEYNYTTQSPKHKGIVTERYVGTDLCLTVKQFHASSVYIYLFISCLSLESLIAFDVCEHYSIAISFLF